MSSVNDPKDLPSAYSASQSNQIISLVVACTAFALIPLFLTSLHLIKLAKKKLRQLRRRIMPEPYETLTRKGSLASSFLLEKEKVPLLKSEKLVAHERNNKEDVVESLPEIVKDLEKVEPPVVSQQVELPPVLVVAVENKNEKEESSPVLAEQVQIPTTPPESDPNLYGMMERHVKDDDLTMNAYSFENTTKTIKTISPPQEKSSSRILSKRSSQLSQVPPSPSIQIKVDSETAPDYSETQTLVDAHVETDQHDVDQIVQAQQETMTLEEPLSDIPMTPASLTIDEETGEDELVHQLKSVGIQSAPTTRSEENETVQNEQVETGADAEVITTESMATATENLTLVAQTVQAQQPATSCSTEMTVPALIVMETETEQEPNVMDHECQAQILDSGPAIKCQPILPVPLLASVTVATSPESSIEKSNENQTEEICTVVQPVLPVLAAVVKCNELLERSSEQEVIMTDLPCSEAIVDEPKAILQSAKESEYDIVIPKAVDSMLMLVETSSDIQDVAAESQIEGQVPCSSLAPLAGVYRSRSSTCQDSSSEPRNVVQESFGILSPTRQKSLSCMEQYEGVNQDRDKVRNKLLEDKACLDKRLEWLTQEEELFLDRTAGILAYFSIDKSSLQLRLNHRATTDCPPDPPCPQQQQNQNSSSVSRRKNDDSKSSNCKSKTDDDSSC